MAFDINLSTVVARQQVIKLRQSIHNLSRTADRSSSKLQSALGGGFGGAQQLNNMEAAITGIKRKLVNMTQTYEGAASTIASGQRKVESAIAATNAKTIQGQRRVGAGAIRTYADELSGIEKTKFFKHLAHIEAITQEGALRKVKAVAHGQAISEATAIQRRMVLDHQAGLDHSAKLARRKHLDHGLAIKDAMAIQRRLALDHQAAIDHSVKLANRKHLDHGMAIKDAIAMQRRRALDHQSALDYSMKLAWRKHLDHGLAIKDAIAMQRRLSLDHQAALDHSAQLARRRHLDHGLAIKEALRLRAVQTAASSPSRAIGAAATTVVGFNAANQGAAALRSTLGALGTSFGIFSASTLIAATGTFMLVRALKSTVVVGAELENSMQRVYAVTESLGQIAGEVTPEMRMLSSAVRDVAKGTIFTATEVAQGAIRFAQAGFSAADTSSALNATAALATIGMTDMGQAANTVTSILNSFGLEATALQRVVDTMSVAVTGSMLNITQLSSALSYIGPLAKETNTSFTETVIILELMADAGVKASKAGTSLRRGMVNLLNPTSRQMNVLKDLNVSTNKASGEMRSMLDIAKDLATEGITPAQLSLLFGARAVAAWTQVINEANGKMVTFIDAQKDIAGSSLVLRRQLEQNLTDQFKLLVSAVQEVQQVLFEQFGPRLTELVVGFKDWVTELGNSQKELVAIATAAYDTARVLAAAGAAVALAAFTIGKIKLAAGTAAVAASVGLLNKSLRVTGLLLLGIVKNPIIATLLAAAAVFSYFRRSVEDSSSATQEQIEATQELVQAQKDLAAASEDVGLAVTRIGYLEAAEGLRINTQAVLQKKKAVDDLAKAEVEAANKVKQARTDRVLNRLAPNGGDAAAKLIKDRAKLMAEFAPMGTVDLAGSNLGPMPVSDPFVTQQTVRQQAIAETNLALEKQLELTFGGREATLAGRMQNLQSGRQRNLPNPANAERFQRMAQDSVPDGGMPQQRAARIAAEVNALTKDAASNLILFDREIKKVTASTYDLRVERMKVSGVYPGSEEQRKAHTAAIVAEELSLKTLLATQKIKPPVDVIKGTAAAFKSATSDIEDTMQAAILTQQHLQKLGESTPTETLSAGIATTRDGLRELNAEFESQRDILLAAQAAKQRILDTVTVDQDTAESTTGRKLLEDANAEINKIREAIAKLEQKSSDQTASFNQDILAQIRSVKQLAHAKVEAAKADAAASVDESAQRDAERQKGVVSAGNALVADLVSPAARLKAEGDEKLRILEEFRILEMQGVSGQHKQEMALKADFASWKLQLQKENLDALAALENEAINKSISAYEAEAKAKESIEIRKTRSLLSGFSSLTSAGARSSKKMFELNKQLSIASIVVDTPAVISSAIKWGQSLGGPVGAAAAGIAAAAKQAILLRQASSASFSGSSVASAPSGSAATPETPAAVVPPASDSLVNQSTTARSQAATLGQQRTQGDVNITVSASSVDTEGMSELLIRQGPVIAGIVRDAQAEQGIS
jgi:TP901 family phage tail tape measure protein